MHFRRRVSARTVTASQSRATQIVLANTFGFRVVNVLSGEKQCAVIAALCEGVSIRAAERLLGVNRGTIMRLGVKVGEGCAVLHGKLMRDLRCSRIEFDELWSFVKKKKRNVQAEDPDTVGDQFIFLAMDSTGKAIISWLVGKRGMRNTISIAEDVRRRVLGNPEISTDGYAPYIRAVDEAFEGQASHGVVDKQEVIIAKGPDAEKYYAKQVLVKVERTAISGNPGHISTSYIERQNLTLRMSQRRLTRLTNGFSKKHENHCAAIALYVAHYNFCRVHEALRITPAMQLGISDHVWSVGELVTAALTGEIQDRVETERQAFRVIQGGRT